MAGQGDDLPQGQLPTSAIPFNMMMDEVANTETPPTDVADLIARIRRYRTNRLLDLIGRTANDLLAQKYVMPITRVRQYPFPAISGQTVHFSAWALAFIAKQSILHGDNKRTPVADQNNLFDLIALYNNLDDPFLHQPEDQPFDAFGYLLRTGWEQFSFQEGVRQLIPRYYALLKLFTEQDRAPVLDIESEWRERHVISIENYMTLGLVAWAKARRASTFRKNVFVETEVAAIRERSTPENLEAFFDLVVADYERFRAQSALFALPSEYVKTEFNALRRYPLIEAQRHELTAPVPELVVERVTKGICYEMQDIFYQPKRNRFKEQLGRNFEAYVGHLLREAYGEGAVKSEPVYGAPNRHGPDWILVEGDTATLFECTVTGTSLECKSIAELGMLIANFGRAYVDRITKYPRKVDDLRAGATGIDMRSVRRFVPVIITHESPYVEPVVRAYVEEALRRQGFHNMEFYLIDIADLEVVTAWRDRRFSDVLDEWQRVYASQPQSMNNFLHTKATAEDLLWINPYLTQTLHRFEAEELRLDL